MKTNEASVILENAKKIWIDWADMWNGNLSCAPKIIADDVMVYLTNTRAENITDAKAIEVLVRQVRNQYLELTYKTDVGPFVDLDQKTITARWSATGIFAGRTSKPMDVPGTSFTIYGTDILTIADGQIVKCWTMNSWAT